MALGLIRIEGGLARGLLAVGILVSAVFSAFFAKWCFANAVSPRAATKEVADLAELFGPDDPQTHYASAVLYEKTFGTEDLKHSLGEYERAAALSPNNYFSWLELGKARGRSGDLSGAERAFLRTLELAPNYADVQWAYGNFLLRAGRPDEGFSQIKTAVNGKPDYMGAAAITAMAFLDDNAESVRKVLGNTGAVNAALVKFAISRKKYDEAESAWDQIPANEKRMTLSELGKSLSGQMAGAKQFRAATRVAGGVWANGETGPTTGKLFNGDFETPVKLKDAAIFDWQIATGAEPQVGVSDAQKHGGTYSLHMIFNTMQATDMRSVSQTIAIEPGRSYSFVGFYRADLKGALAWEILDASDGTSLAKTTSILSSANWGSFQSTFTVPAESDGITIRLIPDGCSSSVCSISGKVWFDDLSVIQRDSTRTSK